MNLFGLEVFSANGNVLYSSNDVTWCQVDFFIIEPNTHIEKYYPAILGREVQFVVSLIDPPPTDRKAIAPLTHRDAVYDGWIDVWGYDTSLQASERAYILVLMR